MKFKSHHGILNVCLNLFTEGRKTIMKPSTRYYWFNDNNVLHTTFCCRMWTITFKNFLGRLAAFIWSEKDTYICFSFYITTCVYILLHVYIYITSLHVTLSFKIQWQASNWPLEKYERVIIIFLRYDSK